MSRPATDDRAALKKARALMKRGLPAAAAARSLAALLGDPKAESRLRAKLAGRRAVTLSFSAEEWELIAAAAGEAAPRSWLKAVIAARVAGSGW